MSIFGKKVVKPENRRQQSNEKIKKLGISCLETLPCLEESSKVCLKDLDTICTRAIACLLSIQLACDIEAENDYEESRNLFSKLLKEYNVEDSMLPKEKKLFTKNYTIQDVVDVAWTYEAYWALLWTLGLVDDIEVPDSICDCEIAVSAVGDCQDYDEFKSKCHLRNIEDILDMLDLYYRYHWACVEKGINPHASIGNLNPEVVAERRRGLEWLISKEEDWNDIDLNT